MPALSLVAALTLALFGAEPLWPDLSALPAATGGGEKDAALVVAVEDYAYLPDVVGAGELGVAWYLYLGKVRKVPMVMLLKDGEATPNKIRNALDAVGQRVKPGGRAWVVFIGHGAPSEDGKDGALVTVTAQPDQVDFFPHTVTQSEVLQRLGKAAEGVLEPVLVVDACFSGTDVSGKTLVKGAQFAVSQEIAEAKEATVLTAGRARDIAGQLPGAERPAFSYLLLGALRGWGDADGDGVVTSQEAVQYAQDAILMLDSGRQQKPQASGKDQPLTAKLSGAALEKGPDLMDIKLRLSGKSAGTGGIKKPDTSATESQPTKTDSGLENRLTELEKAKQARLEEENRKAAEQERSKQQHLQKVEASWNRVKALAESGSPEALQAVEYFLEEYEGNPLGNPYEMEARRWLVRLAAANQETNEYEKMQQAQQLAMQIGALLQVGDCASARLVYQTLIQLIGTNEETQQIDAYIKQCEGWTIQPMFPE